MPGPPYRSALEPFLEFIIEERRKGQTWKAIAEAISAQNGPVVTPQGVQDYFKRRRKKKPRVLMGMEPVPAPVEIQPARTPEMPMNRQITRQPVLRRGIRRQCLENQQTEKRDVK